jgi:hypothetical protein
VLCWQSLFNRVVVFSDRHLAHLKPPRAEAKKFKALTAKHGAHPKDRALPRRGGCLAFILIEYFFITFFL